MAALIGVLVWQRQRVAGIPAILRDAQWGWVLAAVAAQSLSMAALAREQRRLLGVGGARLPLTPVLATVYAANAISATLPLVGSAAAAMFAFTRYAASGVERTVVAWALAVSGVYSAVTLGVLAAIGALVSGSLPAAVLGGITLMVGVLPVTVLLTLLHRPPVRRVVTRLATGLLARTRWILGRRPVAAAIGPSLDRMAALRLGPRSAIVAAGSALVNWLANLGCLCAAIVAVGAEIPWPLVILVWAAGTGVSSMGLTPGGLGVVDATLGAGLIAAGVPAAPAVAAVVVHRAVSLWLVVVIGAIILAVVRSRTPTGAVIPSVHPGDPRNHVNSVNRGLGFAEGAVDDLHPDRPGRPDQQRPADELERQ